ncbi:MAG: adaptor protein MecA [Ruminococcus sp.]
MTIEKLDREKVLISLCNEDMENFSISFESLSLCDERARTVLTRLLHLACNKAGVTYSKKTVLVEAIPHQSGCLILVTLMEKQRVRKVYKVKRMKESPCFCFSDAEAVLSASERINKEGVFLYGNELWLCDDRYYLIFDYPVISKRAKGLLSEYGQSLKSTRVFISRIKESGKLLLGVNAMNTIGNIV